jgi:hypothetical protein
VFESSEESETVVSLFTFLVFCCGNIINHIILGIVGLVEDGINLIESTKILLIVVLESL